MAVNETVAVEAQEEERDPEKELWEFKKAARLFCNEIVAKFQQKQKAGYKGWDMATEEMTESMKGMLKGNQRRGDWVDVGACAAILYYGRKK